MNRGWLFAVLPLATAACSVEEHSTAHPVWSDDDLEVLIAVQHYEQEQLLYDNTRGGGVGFELWVHDLNDGAQSLLLEGEHGAIMEFFMRSSGYILTITTNHDRSDRTLVRFGLDGEVQASRSWETDATPVPSPDGTRLAAAVVECEELPAYPSAVDCRMHIDILDADSLEDVASTGTVEYVMDRERAQGGPGFIWSPDGRLFARQHRIDMPGMLGPTWELEPGEPPTEVEHLPCEDSYWPSTTSSEYARDGREVRARIEDGRPEIEILPGDRPGYPTHCFP